MAVYFLQDEAGFIKIGSTQTLNQRLQALQVGNRQKLTLIGVIPGDEATEKKLQEKFKSFHVRGEWFEPNEMLIFVARIANLLFGHEETERMVQAEQIRGMLKVNASHGDIRRTMPNSGEFSTQWIESERKKLHGHDFLIDRLLALPLDQHTQSMDGAPSN